MTHLQSINAAPADGSGAFRTLLDKGYAPLPIVPFNKEFHTRDGKLKPGGKAPGEFIVSTGLWGGYAGWQGLLEHRASPKQISRWESWSIGGRPNAGILTGNIVAVDIDILDPALADRAHSLAFSMLGATTLIRYGEAPKRLLLYRLEGGLVMGKLKSTVWRAESEGDTPAKPLAIEVLGKGQQFVAFGTHPKTKQPYKWPDASPLQMAVEEVPLTSRAALAGFLEAFDTIMELEGYIGAKKERTTLEGAAEGKASADLVDAMGYVADAIRCLPVALAEDYHEWINVGLAIKGAVKDPALANELWHEFSAKAEVYDPIITDEKWKTFNPTSIGAGTIYKHAADAGWQPPEAVIHEGDFSVNMAGDVAFSGGTGEPLGHEEWLADYEGASLPPREWLLGKQLLRGQVTELVAPGGVGKSTLALSWAAAIAAQRDLTHATPHASGKVWVINNEDDLTELKRRFSAVRSYFDIPWESIRNRIMVTGSGDPKWKIATKVKNQLTATPFVAAAIARIRSEGIVALIVDPLVSTHEADENSNSEMEAIMGLYRQIAVQANCAVCVVHHTSKPPGGSSEGFAGNANAGRGASAVVYAARIALTLFEMSAQDANRYGITEEQRHRYVRLDDAKANLSLKGSISTWFYRATVALGNGDEVGVLKPEKLKEREQADADELVVALVEIPELISSGKISLREAAKHAQAALAIDPEITLQAAMARIKKILKYPAPLLQNCNLFIWHEVETVNPGKGVNANFVCYGARER